MIKLLDSFWRAVMYCLHPRVIALSILPVIITGTLALGLGYFYWDAATLVVQNHLDSYRLVSVMTNWLAGVGFSNLHRVLAPIVILLLAIPVVVIGSLLFVATFMTPSMVALVARRRFPALERKKGGSFLASVLRSLGATLLAGVVLLLSTPLWLVPPLILILPPLIWGWLTYCVMSYDALAEHASPEERAQIFRENKWPLLGIGILSGYLGAAPSLLWASGAIFLALLPVLVPLAIWIYTLVFAFSSLWFSHYCLDALQQLRKQNNAFAQSTRAQAAPDLIVDQPLMETLPKPMAGSGSAGGPTDLSL